MDSINVLSQNQKLEGYSQADLGDKWWQTVYQIPVTQHFGLFDDNSDPRGKRGSIEKSQIAQPDQSPAFFIGGAFGELTTGTGGTFDISRTIILPNKGNATVFFPILNAAVDNLINVVGEGGNLTVDELQALAKTALNTTDKGGLVSDLFASVDGTAINKQKLIEKYRQASEKSFSYTTPYPLENSILGQIGYTNESYLDNRDNLKSDRPDAIQIKDLAGNSDQVTIGPSLADGYWLAVKVAGGDHTLNFGGTLAGTPVFSLDITYNILNQVLGTAKNDHLWGTQGNDYIEGGKGKDYLCGLNGDDLLVGGDGRDVINGGRGNDELWGDAGKDLFIFKPGYGVDKIFDFEHGERIDISAFNIKDVSKIGKTDITLGSKLDATQIDFGGGNQLILVGIAATEVAISQNTITLI